MSKIGNAFKNGKAFIGFLTAGDPSLEDTLRFMKAMERGGADLIELGIPFSDPIAEGIVIQEADLRALEHNTSVDDAFHVVEEFRKESDLPVVFMGYVNPIFNYGYDRFFHKCADIGVDGVIVPDVPFEERNEFADVARTYGIDIISMIAPTSHDRIKQIARVGEGFLYVISSLGVTGTRSEITTDIREITSLAHEVTDVPCAVGFGINTPEQAEEMAVQADGIIVGSAIVKIIARYGSEAAEPVYEYVKTMKQAAARAGK
ncbi:tryptophan synthase subunit alpha [Allisonella histaminiformans]|uniref:tryptophan synthase subunit alpha n=1 Tax=Allisonella histaminiformans TaxID=209880 RepID=UPI0038908868